MNYKHQYLIIAFLFFLLSQVQVCRAGEPPPLDEVANKLQKTYEQTRTIRADFEQRASVTGMPDRQRIGRGTVVIKKPGLIRWDYEIPETQVLVSDGDNFSLYLAEENQMIVTPAEQYLGEDVIFSFFQGSGDILEDFKVDPMPERMCSRETHCLKLTPIESHPQVEILYIWCDRETFMIKRLRIVDPLGGFTDIKFSDITVNQPVDEALFNFTPPPGTEIIRQ